MCVVLIIEYIFFSLFFVDFLNFISSFNGNLNYSIQINFLRCWREPFSSLKSNKNKPLSKKDSKFVKFQYQKVSNYTQIRKSLMKSWKKKICRLFNAKFLFDHRHFTWLYIKVGVMYCYHCDDLYQPGNYSYKFWGSKNFQNSTLVGQKRSSFHKKKRDSIKDTTKKKGH